MTIDPVHAPCPTCNAPVGNSCVTVSDYRTVRAPHKPRITLARTWEHPGVDPVTGFPWAPWLRNEHGQVIVRCPICPHEHRHGAYEHLGGNSDGLIHAHCRAPLSRGSYIIVGSPGVSAAPLKVARWHGQRIRTLIADPGPDLDALAYHWVGLGAVQDQQSTTPEGLPDLYQQAYDQLRADIAAALTPDMARAFREMTSHAS